MIVLNVGGGTSRQLPANYDGWEQFLLDIDPAVKPDICCDAKDLTSQPGSTFDAVYCSHNLEHFYQHEVKIVLAGFKHVLKVGGTVEIHVPDVTASMRKMLESNLDINDVWYRLGNGSPISFHDVLYGWGDAIEQGNPFYAHKCGFTPLSLHGALDDAGFSEIVIESGGGNIKATAKCL